MTEHEPSSGTGGRAEFEQAADEGQSPHEQPNDVSPHEKVETFMGLIPDDSGALGKKLIA